MSVIVPAWIRERNEQGVWAVLGSEPPPDSPERFISADRVESVVESEHEANGRRFGVIVIKGDLP
jgi:hypothetical protein